MPTITLVPTGALNLPKSNSAETREPAEGFSEALNAACQDQKSAITPVQEPKPASDAVGVRPTDWASTQDPAPDPAAAGKAIDIPTGGPPGPEPPPPLTAVAGEEVVFSEPNAPTLHPDFPVANTQPATQLTDAKPAARPPAVSAVTEALAPIAALPETAMASQPDADPLAPKEPGPVVTPAKPQEMPPDAIWVELAGASMVPSTDTQSVQVLPTAQTAKSAAVSAANAVALKPAEGDSAELPHVEAPQRLATQEVATDPGVGPIQDQGVEAAITVEPTDAPADPVGDAPLQKLKQSFQVQGVERLKTEPAPVSLSARTTAPQAVNEALAETVLQSEAAIKAVAPQGAATKPVATPEPVKGADLVGVSPAHATLAKQGSTDTDANSSGDHSAPSNLVETLTKGGDVKSKATEPTLPTPPVQAAPTKSSDILQIDVARGEIPPVSIARDQLVRQVADRLELLLVAKQQDGVIIHLDPPDLGRIMVTVKGMGNAIEAQIDSANDPVRNALEQSRPHLVAALEQRGVQVNSLQFGSPMSFGQSNPFHGANFGGQQQQSQSQTQQQQRSAESLIASEKATAQAAARIASSTNSDKGVNLWL